MVHNVQLPRLREETAHRLLVLLPVSDGPNPVVPPIGHGFWFELVCPQLIGVGTNSGWWLVPEAEPKEHLVSPRQQHLAPLLLELQVLLVAFELVHAVHEGWVAA